MVIVDITTPFTPCRESIIPSLTATLVSTLPVVHTRRGLVMLASVVVLASPLAAQQTPRIEVAMGAGVLEGDQPPGTGLYGSIGLDLPTRRSRVDGRIEFEAIRQSAAQASSTTIGLEILPMIRLTPRPLSAYIPFGFGVYRVGHDDDGLVSDHSFATALPVGAGIRRSVGSADIGLEVRYVRFLDSGVSGSAVIPIVLTITF